MAHINVCINTLSFNLVAFNTEPNNCVDLVVLSCTFLQSHVARLKKLHELITRKCKLAESRKYILKKLMFQCDVLINK